MSADLREDGVDLDIGGMTCASCANRIERKLGKLDGVTATVNFATERAHVTHTAAVSVADLVAAVEAAGYTAAAVPDRPEPTPAPSDSLGVRLAGSATAAVPVVALSMVPALQFDYWQWVCLALTTLIVFWGGYPFHRAALTNARHRAATMDSLVSLGTLAAYAWSVWALVFGTAGHVGMTHEFTFRLGAHDPAGQIYLETAAAVTVFLLAGRYAEAKAKRRAGAALRSLLDVGAKDVAVLAGGVDTHGAAETRIPVQQLRVGDLFVVRPGERIATDGVVVRGSAAVDASTITGESVPVDVGRGDAVIGGTVDTDGLLVVRAEKVGADTQLAHIATLVTEAQNGKAAVARLADRVSSVFVPAVLVLAAVTLAGWLVTGHGATEAFTAAVAVLIVACPCALGLATPTALLVGTGRGAQLGILIRGPEVLEQTRRIDTIVLDKTGTVTTGVMAVGRVLAADGVDPGLVSARAAAVESASEHPVARAIAGPHAGPVTDFANRPGRGVVGTVDGVRVAVGTPEHPVPPELAGAFGSGDTTVAVIWGGAVRGAITVVDAVKPTSAEAVARMRALGMTPVLLTGDDAAVARRVAAEVGIDEVVAGVLPDEKAAVVARLQAEGRAVAMVGDGVNDAAALATADVGLAMGTGTDAAIEAADLTLVRGDLLAVPQAIRLSRATLNTIRGNLFWAFAYNVAALPLAAFGLLNPMIAGAAMAASSVFVVTNSLRLRGFAARA
ncbi:heavy metal translocating P-type ATPase [Rhodococcus sp. NPDC058505]|uniref:heavy metal translocating P-type ATPase n=1 Tax=unclassified Rhodococcus (in: high G+C Gram-positive bacteria) TaxID=192944 RepID=UPI003649A783